MTLAETIFRLSKCFEIENTTANSDLAKSGLSEGGQKIKRFTDQ